MRVLQRTGKFETAFEDHWERPFQSRFKQDQKYALANQIDYLLFRAEQEGRLRTKEKPALMDGGLDLDFYGFTRLFHAYGWLTDAEFDVCRRLHTLIRTFLSPPDRVIAMNASAEIIQTRLAARERINIASAEDADRITQFLNDWLATLPQIKVLRLDVSEEDLNYTTSSCKILNWLD